MSIKYALLVTIIGISMLETTDLTAYSQTMDDEQEESYIDSYDEERQENWFESCAAPCVTGGIVGLISGKISGIMCKGSFALATIAIMSTEDQAKQGLIGLAGLSAIIGTLIAENKLREKCVDWVNKKFEKCGTEPNDLTKNSARISSWIGFLFL